MSTYEPKKIEQKWEQRWQEERIYEPDLDGAARPFYNLWMFPYPSAEGLHIGGARTFVGVDIFGRFKRMSGYDVFQPVGLDGFGIHSENYALKIGKHPLQHSVDSERNFYRQLHMLGNGYAWNEKLETYDPEYYRWTQWIFVELWKRGLAYRKKQLVNWCPKDLTVLADEQVEGGKCERCGSVVEKKDLEQWFFKITDYADRLLTNLEGLDWSEPVKIAQKNWIGRSEGAEIDFPLDFKKDPSDNDRRGPDGEKAHLTVFTTRPDTLFGATYLVLSPEHLWVTLAIDDKHDVLLNKPEVKAYVEAAKKKSDDERISEGKEKTGVELKGVKAINPANSEEIPIFVADYILGSYGTGAIMAVPAHDERDFEFAKKFGLSVRDVVAQEIGIAHANEKRRDGGCGVIFDPETQKYAVAKRPDGLVGLFAGGVEKHEDVQAGVLREITEESGLYDFGRTERIRTCFAHYYNPIKDIHRSALTTCFLVIVKSKDVKPQQLGPHEQGFELAWMTPDEIFANWNSHNKNHDVDHWFVFFRQAVARAIELGYDKTNDPKLFKQAIFDGPGILVNSARFDGTSSETAKKGIISFVQGRETVQYRLRDWLISRQRYWGPPIPMIYCEACAKAAKGENPAMPGWYAVPEKDLPVRLPDVENFRPTGTGASPLASVKEFYEVPCPACKAPARRETDVSDTFLDSSWYFLRYPSARDVEAAWDPARTKKWLPVSSYIGGAEHAVLHLLYSRFIAMVFHDAGKLDFDEPFTKFRAHGLITKDGAKMSKSKGNVVNPDEYFGEFGADAMRLHLAFMAPLEQGGDFQEGGILGVERFLKRAWKFVGDEWQASHGRAENAANQAALHKAIKHIGESIEKLKLNTGVSALMILLNTLQENGGVSTGDIESFLKLLAPYAPYFAEELWREVLGHSSSIHREPWPSYDPGLIKDEMISLVFQVNGKVRDMITIGADVTEAQAKAAALGNEKIKAILGTQAPKRVVYVEKKLVNVVI